MEIRPYLNYNEEEILRLYTAVGWSAYTDDPKALRDGYGASLLVLAACSPKARIDCTVTDCPESDIVVKLLDVNVYNVLDTVCTDLTGHMKYAVDVKPGQPEFIYLFRGDVKIASLLLSEGEKAVVKADGLGIYEVEGSPESVRLADVEGRIARFTKAINSTDDSRELSSLFIAYYRECTRYVLENQKSLTVIPVLFQQLDANTPVFCQYTDAILFRQTLDSLKTVYPESRYVKALEKETERRENQMHLQSMIGSAATADYPELNLPDVNGRKVALSSLGAKAILLHFWDSSVAADKMFNLDRLMPLWERWSGRGLQIYAVDLNTDKAMWASVVRSQNLPWINVNDGLGAASSAVFLYQVDTLPTTFLLAEGNLSNGGKDLDKELARILQ